MTQILATVPAGATTGPAKVFVNGVDSNLVTFTVPSNTISSVSPTIGPLGTQVTVSGSGFGATQGSSTINFNGSPATSIVSWSDTQVVANVPNTATTGPVTVVVNSAESNATIVFTAVNPVIASLSPPASPVGGSVVVNGSGFFGNQANGDQVKFNGVTASIASWSDTSITAIVPAGATSGPVTVTARGVTSSGVSFIVGAQPAITSIFPTVGPVGTSVTVTGSGLGASQSNSTLSFNGTLAVITSWSDTSIVAVVQSGTASGPVSVVVAGVTTQGPAFSTNATFQLTDSLGYAASGSNPKFLMASSFSNVSGILTSSPLS